MGQAVLAPGFRFHPTDQELVVYYLKRKVWGLRLEDGIVGEIDLYKFEPWDLPGQSSLRTTDPEWFFFNARYKKYSHGSRTNRATRAGYWKATGKDRKVCCGNQTVGMKKTLVFYLGRAPTGKRTDWIMHEFRLDEEYEKKRKVVRAVVLCRVHRKSGPGPRNGEQYGAPVVDEGDEKISPAEGIMSDSSTQNCIWLDSDEAQHDQVTLTTSPQISHAMDELSSGEEVQNFVQSLLSAESQDADLEMPPVTQLGLNPIFQQGLNEEAWTLCSDHLPMMEEESSITQITDATSSESMCHPTFKTCPTAANVFDVDVNGLDDLHSLLHPATDEADILEGILQKITGEENSSPTVDSSFCQYDRTTSEAPVNNREMADDDYLELADLGYPLDDFSLLSPTHEVQEYPLSEEDTGIEIRSPSRLTQRILPGQGAAVQRVRLQTPAVYFTPCGVDRSIANEDTLQQSENSLNGRGQSISFEVPVFISRDLTNVLSIESQDAGNIYRRTRRDCSVTDFLPGVGTAEPSNAQGFKARRNMTDTTLHAVSDSKVVMKQLLAADSTFEDLLFENDANLNFDSQGSATLGILPLGSATLKDGDVFPSPGVSGQPSNANPVNTCDVFETAASLFSESTSSSHGFRMILSQFFKLLENVPASPASADELPLGMAQCTPVLHKKASASELTLLSGSGAVTSGATEAVVTARCCLMLESPDSTCRLDAGPSGGAKLLQGSLQIKSKAFLSMLSECKMLRLGESLTPVIFTKICRQLCYSIRKALKIITIRGSTSALIIFCLSLGFWWRLTKSASALTTIFYQNCICPVV